MFLFLWLDAGKSTIGGQIMYLTGMVEKRTLEKYEREAKEKNRETWYLSWALDTNLEGLTQQPFSSLLNNSLQYKLYLNISLEWTLISLKFLRLKELT